MRRTTERIEGYRFLGERDQVSGAYYVKSLKIIASDGGGWDHVSVSTPTRCPTWKEMCEVKSMFWHPNEVVFQLHVADADSINNHQYCLHLWRPQTAEEITRIRAEWGDEWPYGDLPSPGAIPLPPGEFVGIPELGTLA